jgi:protein TonB
MPHALPRIRSLQLPRPARLWWIAVGCALLANLLVVIGLSQFSRFDVSAPVVPLAVRTLHRAPPEPAAPPPQVRAQATPVATAAPAIALPSLDLPTAGPVSDLALPALGVPPGDILLPLAIPAALPLDATGTLAEAPFDTPPERIGDFDLDHFYPRLAKQRGITGSTRVRLHISSSGRVESVEILSSDPPEVFERAAERLAHSLNFRPATRAGQPVAVVQDTVIAWTLK